MPRKNKKYGQPCTIDGCECSVPATKRMRPNIINAINGNRVPSYNQQPPAQNTIDVDTDPQVPLPSQFQEQQPEMAGDDGLNSLTPDQRLIIKYHINKVLEMNRTIQNRVEQFLKSNLEEEIKKREEIEIMLKDKEERAELFYLLYDLYEDKANRLEETVRQLQELVRQYQSAGDDGGRVVEEEVDSSVSPPQRTDIHCAVCRWRPAKMLWLPCRHLCVCMVCERRTQTCPICRVRKTESLKIDLL